MFKRFWVDHSSIFFCIVYANWMVWFSSSVIGWGSMGVGDYLLSNKNKRYD